METDSQISPMPGEALVVNVFAAGPGGGNPAPIVIDASGMDGEAMRAIAAHHGHESGFVLPGEAGANFRFRFFVPKHEMEMCGHATLGATWLLDRFGLLPQREIAIATLSGIVHARAEPGRIAVSQPKGRCEIVADTAAILDVLGLSRSDLCELPILNAATSRVKTLVPVRSLDALHALKPDIARMEALCDAIGSTGLYPFAVADAASARFSARQFPRSSGYPEDPATGIAATALAWGVTELGLTEACTITVRQGEAMGRPSEIVVSLEDERCWLSGHAGFEAT